MQQVFNLKLTPNKSYRPVTENDTLLPTDLCRPLYDIDPTYRPDDYDHYYWANVEFVFPGWINKPVNEVKEALEWYQLYEVIREVPCNQSSSTVLSISSEDAYTINEAYSKLRKIEKIQNTVKQDSENFFTARFRDYIKNLSYYTNCTAQEFEELMVTAMQSKLEYEVQHQMKLIKEISAKYATPMSPNDTDEIPF